MPASAAALSPCDRPKWRIPKAYIGSGLQRAGSRTERRPAVQDVTVLCACACLYLRMSVCNVCHIMHICIECCEQDTPLLPLVETQEVPRTSGRRTCGDVLCQPYFSSNMSSGKQTRVGDDCCGGEREECKKAWRAGGKWW